MTTVPLSTGGQVVYEQRALAENVCARLREYIDSHADEDAKKQPPVCYKGSKYVKFHENKRLTADLGVIVTELARKYWPDITGIDAGMYMLRYGNERHEEGGIHRDGLPGCIQCLCYLSDKYPGGEIAAYDDKDRSTPALVRKPAAGDVLFMPCGTLHNALAISGPGQECKYLVVVAFHMNGSELAQQAKREAAEKKSLEFTSKKAAKNKRS